MTGLIKSSLKQGNAGWKAEKTWFRLPFLLMLCSPGAGLPRLAPAAFSPDGKAYLVESVFFATSGLWESNPILPRPPTNQEQK
ncbi:hypothetical protein Pyn_04038 [Prunus yedoensis var. nudiflora]|uniref:Uncharacterized protein n=1 Tax=Prunus yedoensis var. nudiflora TaxID=2094558 RepID=A0A314Z1P4_PRUYE|nr:hypothetical protein Pyn_04038 [Prunus yedoensis var. nudiflora]